MELSSKEKLSHHHAELERTVELVADVSSRCIAESIEKKNIVRSVYTSVLFLFNIVRNDNNI